MKTYCIIYPFGYSHPESRTKEWCDSINSLTRNFHSLECRKIADGVSFIFSDLEEFDLAMIVFKDVASDYPTKLFLIATSAITPGDLQLKEQNS